MATLKKLISGALWITLATLTSGYLTAILGGGIEMMARDVGRSGAWFLMFVVQFFYAAVSIFAFLLVLLLSLKIHALTVTKWPIIAAAAMIAAIINIAGIINLDLGNKIAVSVTLFFAIPLFAYVSFMLAYNVYMRNRYSS